MNDIIYIEEYLRAGEWLDANYEEIRKKYQDKFIAVKDDKVIAYSDDLDTLINKLTFMREDLSRVLIEFIPRKGVEYIL